MVTIAKGSSVIYTNNRESYGQQLLQFVRVFFTVVNDSKSVVPVSYTHLFFSAYNKARKICKLLLLFETEQGSEMDGCQ